MTIGAELEARILRYYRVEKWRCGTIARPVHVHRGTAVQRVPAPDGLCDGSVVVAADLYLRFFCSMRLWTASWPVTPVPSRHMVRRPKKGRPVRQP